MTEGIRSLLWCLASFIPCLNASPLLYEEFDHFTVTQPGCLVRWCVAALVRQVEVSPQADQTLGQLDRSMVDRQLQRRAQVLALPPISFM